MMTSIIQTSNLSKGPEASELEILRWASQGLEQTLSSGDFADGLCGVLVETMGLSFARLWQRKSERPELELVTGRGPEQPPGSLLIPSPSNLKEEELLQFRGLHVANVRIGIDTPSEAVLQLGGSPEVVRAAAAISRRVAPLAAALLTRERAEAAQRRARRELDFFGQIAGASRYTLDLKHIVPFFMDSLYQIIEFDNAALLLLDPPAKLTIHTNLPVNEALAAQVRDNVLSSLRVNCGIDVSPEVVLQMSQLQPSREPATVSSRPLQSSINTPLWVDGEVAGLIHLSAGRKHAFDAADASFLDRAAHFLALSVKGLRETLATINDRLEVTVEHMADGVILLDERGSAVVMNASAHTILKTDSSVSLLGADDIVKELGFSPVDVMKAERKNLRKLVQLHGIPYQIQLSPVEGSEGELVGVVTALRNFAKEKRIEEMKSEFVNVASHELRTPLTSIKNALTLFAGSRLGNLNEKQHRFVQLARRNTDHLEEIINDLLDLSRIKAGRMHIELTRLSLAEPLEAALSSLRPEAEQKKIRLLVDVPESSPEIHGNEVALRRIFVNLLGNALKFTSEGGEIAVHVSIENSSDKTDGSPQGKEVRVVMADTGIGIPEDHLGAIFEKFHRVSSERQKVAGTGLGLSITRELVEAHHGAIDAESQLGKGSRFTVTFPILSEDEVFYRSVDQELEKARASETPVSLAVSNLPKRLAVEWGRERYLSYLRKIEHILHGLCRETDRIWLRAESGEVAALLYDMAEGRQTFLDRFQAAVKETMPECDSVVQCDVVVFPKDGNTARELHRSVTDRRQAQPNTGSRSPSRTSSYSTESTGLVSSGG